MKTTDRRQIAPPFNGGRPENNRHSLGSFLMILTLVALLLPPGLCAAPETRSALKPLPRLRVSDNHRFLVEADGKPFFWLTDPRGNSSTG